MVLRDTNLSLNQIAANLDFSSSKQICRLFMEENNISPIQYRKMHQLKG
jgi:transcriptional regulator GlxA family with amidase domain